MTTKPFPGAYVKVLSAAGFFATPWVLWLQQFGQQPSAPSQVVVGASPFTYTASGSGNLVISGGTITGVTFIRGPSSVSLGTIRTIPMANADVATVAFTGTPTAIFIPS